MAEKKCGEVCKRRPTMMGISIPGVRIILIARKKMVDDVQVEVLVIIGKEVELGSLTATA